MADISSHPFKIKKHALIGAVYAFLAAVGFSAKAVLVKLAYSYSVDAVTLLTLRMLFSLPFFLFLAVWSANSKDAISLSTREWVNIVLLGLLGIYLASLLDFLGLTYITASLERLVVFLYPTLVVILSAFIFKRRIAGSIVFALVFCYGGIALVFAQDVSVDQKDVILGGGLVFASVLAYAIYLVSVGHLIARLGTARFTSYAMTVSSMAAIVHFGIINPGGALIQPLPVYGLALIMALFATVLPALMLSEGIRLIGVDRASIIGSFGPVATLLLAYLFLGEVMTLMQMFGAALVLVGVVFISLQKS